MKVWIARFVALSLTTSAVLYVAVANVRHSTARKALDAECIESERLDLLLEIAQASQRERLAVLRGAE